MNTIVSTAFSLRTVIPANRSIDHDMTIAANARTAAVEMRATGLVFKMLLNTTKSLGLTVTPSMLAVADDVIWWPNSAVNGRAEHVRSARVIHAALARDLVSCRLAERCL